MHACMSWPAVSKELLAAKYARVTPRCRTTWPLCWLQNALCQQHSLCLLCKTVFTPEVPHLKHALYLAVPKFSTSNRPRFANILLAFSTRFSAWSSAPRHCHCWRPLCCSFARGYLPKYCAQNSYHTNATYKTLFQSGMVAGEHSLAYQSIAHLLIYN